MRTTGNGCSSGTEAAAGGSPAAGGGANTGFAGTSKGVDAGRGAGVSSGTGVGVGVGVGVGEGVESGAASMTLVGPDRASAVPALLVTLTRARSTEPTSAAVTRYSGDAAPLIPLH
jgi:hypothetical protein